MVGKGAVVATECLMNDICTSSLVNSYILHSVSEYNRVN